MSDKIPHDCPVCKFMMRDMNDILSYEEYGCCTECQDHFAYRDLHGWMSGNRPCPEEVEQFQGSLRERSAYLVSRI